MAGRPNILIVCTDQQRCDTLSCYGSDFVSTPGFDRVARDGTRFGRAYCPSAVCTPSRVSMLTGQYPKRHGAWSTGVNAGEDTPFLSHRLAAAGYRTALIGKAHFEAYMADPDRSRESVAGSRDGYGDWTGPYYGFETALLAPGHAAYGICGHYGHWVAEQAGDGIDRFREIVRVEDGPDFGGNAHDWDLPARLSNSAWTAGAAIDFLEQARDPDRPFVLMVSFQDPHHPHAVPRDYDRRVDPARVPSPEWTEGELDDMPPLYRLAHEGRLAGSGYDARWPVSGQHTGFDYRPVCDAAARLGRSYYHTMVHQIDDQLVRLWSALDVAGLTEETLVFVTSDHGELLGDHGLWMKGPFHYEPLARVPLLAMGPGIDAGATEMSLASLVDIAPTCLAAAGVPPETPADGIDLRNARRGPGDTVLCETIMDWDGHVCRTVIGQRHKLSWTPEAGGQVLFDLAADPGEIRNLAADPAHDGTRADLLSALAAHDTRMHRSTRERIAYA